MVLKITKMKAADPKKALAVIGHLYDRKFNHEIAHVEKFSRSYLKLNYLSC